MSFVQLETIKLSTGIPLLDRLIIDSLAARREQEPLTPMGMSEQLGAEEIESVR